MFELEGIMERSYSIEGEGMLGEILLKLVHALTPGDVRAMSARGPRFC
jgi:hypothetical protein